MNVWCEPNEQQQQQKKKSIIFSLGFSFFFGYQINHLLQVLISQERKNSLQFFSWRSKGVFRFLSFKKNFTQRKNHLSELI